MEEKFKDYLKAILNHYQIVRNGEDLYLLDDPTPANLKRLCLEVLDKNFKPKDEDVFNKFFEPQPKTLHGAIKIINADSVLKTPSNFLRTGKPLKKIEHADILAIILGFEPRPYAKFQRLKLGEKEEEEKKAVEEIPTALTDTEVPKEEIKEKEEEKVPTAETPHPEKQNQIQAIVKLKPNASRPRKIALVSTAVLLFGGMSGFLIHKTTEKQCMVWKENHYERTDCQQPTIQALMAIEKVEPYNEELFAQEKITPTDTTTFFKNGRSAIFYLITDNKIEFFKQPGYHPIHTERKLRRITKTIMTNWKNDRYAPDTP